MYGMVLQNWVVISGSTNNPVVQEDADWLDMTDYQDLTAWIDVRASTNSPTLYLETAPAADEVLFASMNTTGYTMTASTTPLVAVLALGLAAVPLAQLLRWRIVPPAGGSWDATFRILIAANAPGLISPGDETAKLRAPIIDIDPIPSYPIEWSPRSGLNVR